MEWTVAQRGGDGSWRGQRERMVRWRDQSDEGLKASMKVKSTDEADKDGE